MGSAGPFTRRFHNLGQGELTRLVHRKALGAQQDGTHVVKGVRLVELESAKVGHRPMCTRLRLEPAKGLCRVYLLDEKGAGRALEGVVGGVGVRPGKTVTVQVRSGEECLQPLLLVGASSRRGPVLSLGWLRFWQQLPLRFTRQVAPWLVARFEVKRGGFSTCQHCPRPACQEVGNFLDNLIKLRNGGRVLPPRNLSGSVLARFVGKLV